jgi:hypothetical protein
MFKVKRGGVLPSNSSWRLAERNLFREILEKSSQVVKAKGFDKLFDVCKGRLMTRAELTHFHASKSNEINTLRERPTFN